jgi:two-component system nitrogen regulation response regulator GlnG
MSRKLLVIDDDEPGCELLKAVFEPKGFEVIAAYDGPAGLKRAIADRPDVVALDLKLPGMDGLEVLEELKKKDAKLPVIVLTGHGEVRSAVRATQLGAFDFLVKSLDFDELRIVVQRALDTRALQMEVEELRLQATQGGGLNFKMGSSAAIQQVVDKVRTVAASDFSVLVLGETGTGKELVSQAIHYQSERRGKPFIAIDCGAIPEQLMESELFGHERGAFTGAEKKTKGHFHLAEGGTLFLDEVGNLPVGLQSKLLRVLESRQVQSVGSAAPTPLDVRFVAATNDDLQIKVKQGQFRADLYFRLAQYTIAVPPLRDRPSDIPYLAQRFLEEASVELRRPVHQIPADVVDLLQRHPWPGNVRELRNVVRQSVLETQEPVLRVPLVKQVLRKTPDASIPTPAGTDGRSLKETADEAAREAERQAICEALRVTQGNKSQAAKALRTDYKTLHLKMKHLGIRARDFNP